ncbi:MAG: 50S ribosomal protein L1 [Candidatus Lindowbacteria bacterium RIFCSPLOWO2_12_FULL_62_27]|nr:MAG: 50S ribosomal protein L1 [Candidatus Lindowbacteria bacterium RIFCSPLOWO2_02_FULL_62_12]OGH62492.1 MAG: 50S ribosomal protein L1 [Candidatus Lindowbacteria bacterium RIFCSPLOWO2_12_FULL_62_27]
MKRRSKRYRSAAQLLEAARRYRLREAVGMVKKMATAKFDETVTMALRLGIDPTKAEEQVRGSVVLPGGTGKKIRILVFAKGEKISEARAAGADLIADDELFKKIQEGFLEFDAVISTPDEMAKVGKLGKILGPRGLMPSPKTGTVTADLKGAVDKLRAGQVSYRNDKEGNVHMFVGKASFSDDALFRNAETLVRTIIASKPRVLGGRGEFFRAASIAPCMGPAVALDPVALWDDFA